MKPQEENLFDDLLRQKLGNLAPQPDPGMWNAVRQSFPQPRLSIWQRLLPVLLGMLAGIGLMLALWRPWQPVEPGVRMVAAGTCSEIQIADDLPSSGEKERVTSVRQFSKKGAPASSVIPIQSEGAAMNSSAKAMTGSPIIAPEYSGIGTGLPAVESVTLQSIGNSNNSGLESPLAVVASSTVQPAVLSLPPGDWQNGYMLDTALVQAVRAASNDSTIDKEQLGSLLKAQGIVLARLQQRHDSLKKVMAPELLAAAEPVITADSVIKNEIVPEPLPRNWLLALQVGQTAGWGTQVIGADSTRATELALYSKSTDLSIAHRLTDRLQMSAGLGYTQLTTELTFNGERLRQIVQHDTATVFTQTVMQNVDTTFQLSIDSVMQLEPVLNLNGQLIGYDTSYTQVQDTVFQVTINRDTIQTTEQVITQRLETSREKQQQRLRPEYRFVTVPLAVHYRLASWGRLSMGLRMAGRLTLFRGGTQPVWRNGQYELQKVGPKDGPFRPVSLALNGALEFNYQLTNRLAIGASPVFSWWVLSPYKQNAVTKTPLPGVQIGLSWGL
jgi:hypothetical protein